MSTLIGFALEHQFFSGLVTGVTGFGAFFGAIGWSCGYATAMRRASSWMRPALQDNEAHGDVPNLPPVRERRWIPTVGRS